MELLEEVIVIYLKIIHLLLIIDQYSSLRHLMHILFLEHQTLMKKHIKKNITNTQVLEHMVSRALIWQILNIKTKQNQWLPEMDYLNSVTKHSLDQLLMIK